MGVILAIAAAIAAAPASPDTVPPARTLEMHTLVGPYASLAAFGARAKRDGEATRCRTGPRASRKGLEGAIEATWVRCEVDIAGARVTDCLLAVRSAKGWFVDEQRRLRCGGRLGPLSSVKSRFDPPAWKDPVLLARFETDTIEGEWREGGQGKKEPAYPRPDENRWLIICGVGSSGVPSCSEPLVLGCSSGRSSARVSAQLSSRTLTLASDDADACDRGALLVGEFRLDFP